MKEFKFTRKGLIIVASIILAITIFGIPFAIVLLYVGFTSKIWVDEENLYYKMLYTRTVPFKSIHRIMITHAGYSSVPAGQILRIGVTGPAPLKITYGDGKTTQFAITSFENPQEIMNILQKKTGLEIENPYRY